MKKQNYGLGTIGWTPCFSFKWAGRELQQGERAMGHEGFRRWKIARKAWKTRKARQREFGL